MIEVVFLQSTLPFGRLISHVTKSEWTHTGIRFGPGGQFFIHATGSKGVNVDFWDRVVKHYKKIVRFRMRPHQKAADFALAELANVFGGRPYDWAGVIGFGFAALFRWQRNPFGFNSRLVCSELSAHFVNNVFEFGIDPRQFTPEMLYQFLVKKPDCFLFVKNV